MGRSPCCSKEGLNRGAWTALEDKILTAYIKAHGEGKWRNLPKRAGLKRCGKSCRLRWLNYLRPDIKRGNISHDEEELIIRLHNLLGNRWSLIAGRLPGRTDNEIKNYWNTTLGKKAKAQTKSEKSNSGDKNHAFDEQKRANFPASSSPAAVTTTKPQVIRTRATRCTRVLFPLNPPNEEVETNNIMTHSDRVEEFQDQWNQTEGVPMGLEEENPLNFGHDDQYSLPFPVDDEELFKNWTGNPCLEGGNLDLDSLELFLSEEWLC